MRLLPVPVNRLRSPSSAFTARQPPWSPPEEAGQGRNMQNAEASRGSRWLEDISGKRLRRSLDQFRSYQSKTPALTSGLAVARQTLSSILFSTCYFCKQWYSEQFATDGDCNKFLWGMCSVLEFAVACSWTLDSGVGAAQGQASICDGCSWTADSGAGHIFIVIKKRGDK